MKKLPTVAYFSMEFGLDSNFKIYAGGLGILAGDYLKAAKDLGYPVVGVGILWKQGYNKQIVTEEYGVIDAFPIYRYNFLKDTGVKVKVRIRNRDVYCKVWKVDNFENADLYLLDTDLPENADRWITGQLYGWFGEERVAQEMVLGIGGVRALKELGIKVDVYHFNEGHAVFAGLELVRYYMEEEGLSFEQALSKAREKIVFTTHTPVEAGNETHPLRLLMYMGANLNLTEEQLVYIGGAPFNMTVAALRLARISNAVSDLHRITANAMWAQVDRRSRIIGITNGVHVGTWADRRILESRHDPEKLWQTHTQIKRELLDFVEKRTGIKLREDVLTIGFARRAAPYKRSDLIFRDKEAADKMFKNDLQIIFAGKSHPLDDTGKEIVNNIIAMSKKYPGKVVFLEDYDMEIGKMLTRGCDIWLNNPRRPLEACGTSGMKAAMNGVLNVSTLDGWWPEACQHGINGWQIGDGFESKDEKEQDSHDLKSLVNVMQNEVIPTYYKNRDRWVKMMQNSIESTLEKFSAERMVKEYYEKMYIQKSHED
ncbi:alpha-glucan phosphorylase [Caldicellulosiruptor hydrothermalis 108]|uniref:glycogen phosphorylase n=1 Tax=Caldicellulosiruptor hydrothermalis (strain DSM 18901 / VKM B-2411 / 108) TaxID=632292 RepID=E4QB44_CALH1|nr:alpha-glucan family phosphorylase [Caldicellulosiruptor hydrothermalis]ADQ06022.1 alpha-glucan phosphorylase [Caldicellulosiruptor hydrothermalis 108]